MGEVAAPYRRLEVKSSSWQRILFVMFVAQLLASIGFSTIFPFLPNYVEFLGVRSGGSLVFWVAAVFSVQAAAMMIASPIWGAIADRHGRKLMLERAFFAGAAVILLMGFVRSAEELTFLRLIQGLTTGVVSAANSMVAATAPRQRLGYAMGMMQTASWAGASVGPMIGGALQYFFGFRFSFVVTAALMLAGGLLVLFGVKEDFTAPPRAERGVGGLIHAWRDVVRTAGVPLAYFLRFSAWLGRTMLVPFLPLFIATITVDKDLAGMYTGLAIGLAAASSTLSGVLLGRLSDRVGYKPILVASALGCAVFYVPMAYVTDVVQLIVVNVLIGFAIGGVLPAISAMLARLTPRNVAGAVYGLDNSVAAASRALAPIIAGAIVTVTSLPGSTNYRTIFLVTAGLFLITALVAAWRLPRSEREALATDV